MLKFVLEPRATSWHSKPVQANDPEHESNVKNAGLALEQGETGGSADHLPIENTSCSAGRFTSGVAMIKKWLAKWASVLSIGLSATAAYAASVTQPGEQVGLAVGAPLPEGLYVVDTFDYGRREDVPGRFGRQPWVGVNIPFLAWSTPWKILGARLEFLGAVPTVGISTRYGFPVLRNVDESILYNPLVAGILAWDLGNNFGVSYLLGAYLPFGDRGSIVPAVGFPGGTPVLPNLASTTIRNEFSASYTGDGLNLTASLTHGLTVDPHARFGGPVGAALGPIAQADWLNLDLTATKKFGKFEIGPVAFASVDLPVNRNDPLYRNYTRVGQIAVGGLIGYDFGPFTAQVYATRDVAIKGYQKEDTRGWFRIIVPLTPTAGGTPAEPTPGDSGPGPLARRIR